MNKGKTENPVKHDGMHRPGRLVNLLKDKYFWILSALVLAYIAFIYIQPVFILAGWDTALSAFMVYNIALYRFLFIAIAILATSRYGGKSGIYICLSLSPAMYISYFFNLQNIASLLLDIGILVLGIVYW
jgi:hypothetical protein